MSRFLKHYWLIILSALLLSVSRLPLHTGFLVFVAFIPLLHYINRKQTRFKELLLAGLIFSTIQILIVFYWIGSVTIGGLIGICLLFGLFYSVLFWMLHRIWHRLPGLRFLAFVALFISFEYLQNFGEMRFPWFHIGYALSDYLIMLQILDLGGICLMGVAILSINFLIYTYRKHTARKLGMIAALLALWLGYGYYCIKSLYLEKSEARISVMQPSIPQEDKWIEDNYGQIIARYDSLSALAFRDQAELLIFPEAAIPNYVMLIPEYYSDLRYLVETHQISIFTGFPHSAPAPASHPESAYYYNAANLFSPHHRMQEIYFKNILVPVGERMLWLDHFPILWKLQFGQANWEFGTKIPRYMCGKHDFAPSICYELAFPHFMQKANFIMPDGLEAKADYHVNITNDAWFGTSYGPWLHGIMSKYRAIESRIQIYRSANTGISMIVDPMGRVLKQTSLFSIENITAPLYISSRIPLYHKIYTYPKLFVYAALAMFLLSLFFARRS
ncbi:MAG: apolipoprotein N-acyltransferase [Candidatus Cloacimonetes bacterium]|nr:apolipoprotein N-acyltransferase [Candidatus Cloacimonadota bacterium]